MTPAVVLVLIAALVECVAVLSRTIARLARWLDGKPKRSKSMMQTVPIFSRDSWRTVLDVLRSPGRIHVHTAARCHHYGRDRNDAAAPFELWIPGWSRRLVVLSSPSAFEDVLRREFDAFPKGEHQCGKMRDLLGKGIFAVDGEQWRRQRKLASRLFTARALRESMSAVVKRHVSALALELGRHADRECERSTVDLFELLGRFTFDVFAEIGFGVETDSLSMGDAGEDAEAGDEDKAAAREFQRAFDSAQRAIARRFVRPEWLWKTQRWLGLEMEGQLRHDLAAIDSASAAFIDKCMAQSESKDHAVSPKPVTIVSLLLQTNERAGTTDVDRERLVTELRDAVVNFMLAGRDTTAQTLTWLFYCLARSPRVEAELRKKLRRVHTDADSPSQAYLEAAIRETLRLYPPVPFTYKDAIRDVILSDGTPIRAGTTVGLAFFAMGRDPNVWGPDAAEFRPERWIQGSSSSCEPKIMGVPSCTFTAFNAGPRACLGANLAMLELKTVAATLLRAFRFKLAPEPGSCGGGEGVEPDLALTLPPRGGLHVYVHRFEH